MTASTSSRSRRRLPPRDPKGGRPPQEIAAQLGVHILDVALDQFIAHGVEGSSMEVIAAAANVSKRTLYARFGSKTGLLVAAVEHGIGRHLRPITTTVPAGSVREKLLYVARRMLDASLKREAIGLGALVAWIAEHATAISMTNPRMGSKAGIAAIQAILEEVHPGTADVEKASFLARFIFHALIGAPRTLILDVRELENTPQAKTEYLERTMNLIVQAIPFLDEARSVRPLTRAASTRSV